ncbi:unnamed protein product [Larinioides sclopetarius]|uniref:Uncharacterized protein n=1 Tax=Larinioides sclopetarius TaxID=280406 RepID=A0AAV1ZVZ7_9ARAC
MSIYQIRRASKNICYITNTPYKFVLISRMREIPIWFRTHYIHLSRSCYFHSTWRNRYLLCCLKNCWFGEFTFFVFFHNCLFCRMGRTHLRASHFRNY